ncbi:hypothetical protein [Caenimonas koreensis]|uniref:Uncharacterized protein n=1 Tax=Caenimonas koreensis DSM 17982 TaxID=1121255 RepID=A0A844B836_9BURK|nr:hypothetical protein [Caenimonas koreensis]MRD47789.1 hypothetical protein [Caenimonas koreensis DSM 17982]
MELHAARQIIDTLAQGIHPVTGAALPDDSPYNAPPVIRALVVVSKALDVPFPHVPVKVLPPNAGKPWTEADDQALVVAFDAGVDTKAIMAKLGRTRFSVEARLVKLGKLQARDGSVPFRTRAV